MFLKRKKLDSAIPWDVDTSHVVLNDLITANPSHRITSNLAGKVITGFHAIFMAINPSLLLMNYPAASCGVARMALGLLIRSKLRGIRPGRD